LEEEARMVEKIFKPWELSKMIQVHLSASEDNANWIIEITIRYILLRDCQTRRRNTRVLA
jgi:hypothetical protein